MVQLRLQTNKSEPLSNGTGDGSVPAQSAIFNSDFEWGSQTAGPGGFNEHNSVDHTSVPGWLITVGGVQRYRSSALSSFSGSWSLGLGSSSSNSAYVNQVGLARVLGF